MSPVNNHPYSSAVCQPK